MTARERERENAERQEEQRDELDGDGDPEEGGGAGGEEPFRAWSGGAFETGEQDDGADHGQDHEAVEMGGAGEAVNDEGIPGVPGGVGVARGAGQKQKEECGGGEVGGGEEEFVNERSLGEQRLNRRK